MLTRRLIRRRKWLLQALVLIGATLLTSCTGVHEAPAPTSTSYEQYDALYADWANSYISCVRGYGVDAQLGPQGTIQNSIVPGRETREGLDAGCLDTVGDPPDVPAPTDAFMKGLYELYLKQADCLREHGYTISGPPSRDDWVENYDGSSWNPLMDVYSAGRDVQEADNLCPQPEPRDAEKLGSTL
ncbi:MAG: hypothetical protein ABIR17_01805 [Pseudolysinimonas sp.]|uniref:hypothetical protein n=1 Tax=Pseudolysinimonas sp. TaxID=2680009 RepID=UPI0032663B8C